MRSGKRAFASASLFPCSPLRDAAAGSPQRRSLQLGLSEPWTGAPTWSLVPMDRGLRSVSGTPRHPLPGVSPLCLLTRQRLCLANLYLRLASSQGGGQAAS